MEEQEIRDLIEDYRVRGDEAAFRTLFALYEKQIWAFILHRNIPREDAEAIFQEVGLTVTKVLRKQIPDHFVALVFKITRDSVANYFRRRGRTAKLEIPLEDQDGPSREPAVADDPHQQWIDFEYCRHLLTMCRLTPEQKEAFVLRYGQELTVGEVAQCLDVSPETIKGRIYLGKKKIKTYLDRQKRSRS